jgi:hypothetical protein
LNKPKGGEKEAGNSKRESWKKKKKESKQASKGCPFVLTTITNFN